MSIQDEIAKHNDLLFKDWRRWPAWYWALALTGEAGELANVMKKELRLILMDFDRYPDLTATKIFCFPPACLPPTGIVPRLADELADVEIYARLLAESLGIDLDAAVRRKLPVVMKKVRKLLALGEREKSVSSSAEP